MDASTLAVNGLNFAMKAMSVPVLVKYFSYTSNPSDYDDMVVSSLTGSVMISGLVTLVEQTRGSEEAMLMEQGKIKTSDSILYTGSLNTNSGLFTATIGSNVFTPIPIGVHMVSLGGSDIYHKIFLRYCPTGSLY